MTSLPDRLRADLTTAMRAKDRETVKVLRTVLSAIANAEAQPSTISTGNFPEGPIAGATEGLGSAEVERRVLTVDDVRAVVEAERAERAASAELLESSGAPDAAEALRREAALLEQYLS